jgi:hypothetical protein
MIHHTLSETRLRLADARAQRGDDATRLVPSNNRLAAATQANRRTSPLGTVGMQVAAAHAGSFHFQYHFPRPGCWIGKFPQLQLPTAKKYHTTHTFPSYASRS